MKTLLRFLKPYWPLAIATIAALLADVAGALLIPTILADIINVGVTSGNLDYVLHRGAVMLGVTLLSGAGALVGNYLCASLASKIARDIRNAVYDASLAFSGGDFERFGTGSMITRTLNDVNVIQSAFMMTVQMILPVPIMCVMGIVLAFSIDVQVGWLLFGIVVVVLALAVIIVSKAAVIFAKLQRFIDRMNVVLRENVTGVRVIRAFGKEPHEKKRLDRAFSDYATSAIRVNYLFSGLDSFSFFLMNLACVLVIWLGGNRVGAHAMEIGSITALTEYAILILFYVMMAEMVALMLPRAKICLARAQEVIGLVPEIRDGDAGASGVPEGTAAAGEPSEAGAVGMGATGAGAPAGADGAACRGGEVVAAFEGATFRFPDADEDTLHDITFACRRGQTTAIIGSTGSGKSTIAKMLLRLHDVTGGRVTLDGNDVRAMAQADLRDRVAYVPQKAWLFSGTIADNLRYGDPDATDEQMRHALEVAQGQFVFELPGGLGTRVAQGGTNFSGGQRQRLSIARALVKRADLYVFDDSFSALDFKTDAALRAALKREVSDAAVLIIAQRINTVLHADQIVVLKDGRVVGLGTHDELMEGCPTYRSIAESQMKGGEAHA